MIAITTFPTHPDLKEEVDELIEQKHEHPRPKKYHRSNLSCDPIKMPKSGYGRCRSCDCKGYISKHNGTHECKNCQHHFDRHYD